MTKRTYLITGASKGIGRAISERLISNGHHVVGLARNMCDFPGDLIATDLSDRVATQETLSELVLRYDFDGVVNNVGAVQPASIDELSIESLTSVLSLNLNPAVMCTQAVLPSMRKKGWGRVLNVSSLTVLGMPGRSAYAASKSALISFVRTWALELAQTGITVNGIAPGPTETELFRQSNPVGSPAEQTYINSVPMRRLGSPGEVAAAVAFLLSEDAGYITGQTLFVDGGASIGKSYA